MKKYLLVLFLLAISFTSAQIGDMGKARQRLEAFEQSKLIEFLNLDEETAIRFFARRNESTNKIKNLIKKRDDNYKSLRDMIRDDEIEDGNQTISSILKLEKEILTIKEEFILSLDDILTETQILKLVFFEHKFRKEVKDILLDRRKGGGPPPRRGF